MKKLLNKEQHGVIAQLCSLEVPTSKSSISLDLQKSLENHLKVFATPKGLPPIHDNYHDIHLIPGSVPPNIRSYRCPYVQKTEIECMVAKMLEAGIIQPSLSSFFAPVVLVDKKDGSWRMCMDYRELNKITIKDKFPIHVINELLDEFHGAIYFTKLDLHSRYHQIIMKTGDIPKRTFRTHEGHYEFLVIPFGLTNVASTFQGVKLDPSKIKFFKEWKIPTSIKHLRGFLGLTGYYHKFVNNYGRIEEPITTLLKKDAFSWTLEETKAFKHFKEAMSQALALATPDFTKTFIVEFHASRNGIGLVLMQE
eukprot:PITA_25754